MTTPEIRNAPIIMVRDNLDNIPQFSLPAGYTFRWYQPGDEEAWIQVQSAAERIIPINLELYQQAFGTDPAPLRERQVFVMDNQSNPVGTISSWYDDAQNRPEWGRLHWLAIVPEHQGKGLSKPMMSIACNRLRELGHTRAYLATSSTRIPAINLYLQFGFKPEFNNFCRQEFWEEIEPLLKIHRD